MKHTDHHFHTDADVAGYLERALKIMRDAELSPDEHPHLLVAIDAQLAHKQVFFEQRSAAPMVVPMPLDFGRGNRG